MEFKDILYERRGRIAYVTINRPEVHNAICPTTNRELVQAFEAFDADPEVWVAILSGAGEKAFCAGNDIKWGSSHPEEQARWREQVATTRRHTPYWNTAMLQPGDPPRASWKPVIGAVKGYCLGGGLELAMHCDILVAGENAVFGMPEVTHGWTGSSGNFNLPRHIPRKVAMEMLLFGDRIDASRAYELGLVNKVVPVAEVMDAATGYARRLVENPPLAVRAIKELALRGLDMPMNYAPLAWHLLNDAVNRVALDSEDVKEGRRAFAEKRKPEYKGR